MEAILIVPLFYILGLLIFYGIVRLAVAHGMRDAWRWRDRNQQR